jgi:hypothetical protein
MSELGSAHPVPEDLTRYLADRLSPEDELKVELHLADCDGCAEACSETWSTMQALERIAAEVRAVRSTAIRSALERLALGPAATELSRRVRGWLSRLEVLGEDIALRAAAAVTVASPADSWQLVSAGARGGDAGASTAAFEYIAPSEAAPLPQTSAMALRASAGLDRGKPYVLVEVEGAPADLDALVVLAPSSAETGPMVRRLEPSPLGGLFARFENLPDGEYLVALEPLYDPPNETA